MAVEVEVPDKFFVILQRTGFCILLFLFWISFFFPYLKLMLFFVYSIAYISNPFFFQSHSGSAGMYSYSRLYFDTRYWQNI